MAKTGQFRYCYDGSPLNYPSSLTYERLTSGIWLDEDIQLIKLDISGPQGLGFFLNNTPTPIRLLDYNENFQVSQWSLDETVGNISPVYNIKFEAQSLYKLVQENLSIDSELNPNGYTYIIMDYTQVG